MQGDVHPQDDLAEVVWLMQDGSVRSVPIVQDEELVGIVTRRDVLRVIARREVTSEDIRRRRDGQATREPRPNA